MFSFEFLENLFRDCFSFNFIKWETFFVILITAVYKRMCRHVFVILQS